MHPTTRERTPIPVTSAPALHPDHHLWRNGRRWWIAIVLLEEGGRHFRLRRSLATTDVALARLRRDRFLARLAGRPGLRPSSPRLAATLGARAPGDAPATTAGERTGPPDPTRRVA